MAEIVASTIIATALNMAVSYLFPTESEQSGNRLNELNVIGSRYGAAIPKIYGRMRVPGNIIWAKKLREEVNRSSQSAGKGSTVTSTEYNYYATFTALLCEGADEMRPLKIFGDKKLLWEAPDTDLHLTGDFVGGGSFEFMPGGPDQLPSSIMEAVLGVDDTPAFRGRCNLVVNELPVEQFGRRPPVIEVVVARGAANASAIISDVLLDICLACGLTESQVDVSEVDNEVHGVQIGPDTGAAVVQNIVNGLGLQIVCTGTTIAFKPVEQTPQDAIDDSSFGAGESRFPQKRLRDDILPRSVEINYFDPEREYQPGNQIQRRQSTRSVQAITLSAPFAISAAQAFQIADTILYRAWVGKKQYGPFTLTRKFIGLEPGDVLPITVDGVEHSVRLTTVSIGGNLLVECSGEAYDPLVLTGATGGGSGDFEGQVPPDYGTTTLRLLDVPGLTDVESSQIGFRVAATGSGPSWRSAVLEVSVDAGTSWVQAAAIGSYTILGFCGTILPDPPPSVMDTGFDEVSTVSVTLVKGTLSSVTDELLLAGANRAMIGDEMIQFGTATLVSPGTYTLSHLLRGRRGTDWAMADHVADEEFNLLSSAPFVAGNVAAIGSSRLYRITPNGGDASSSVAFTYNGASAKPFSPTQITGVRDGGLNLAIDWFRRSRIGTELPDNGDIPMDEPNESYMLEILDAGTVVRTVSGLVTSSYTYTAADQTTDFGSAQPAVDVRIRQVGQYVSGTPAEATI